MKKARFIALLCALVMLLGMTSAASAKTLLAAESNSSTRAMEWNSPVLLENGKTITLFYYSSSEFYDEYGNRVADILFDCAGAVKGKCTDSWITLKETSQGFAITGIETNPTQKKRTGTITVTGSSYSAKIQIVQVGQDKIASMKRSKKKITITFSLGDADFHYVRVSKNKLDKDGNIDWSENTTYPVHTMLKGKKLTFTAEKGYRYYVNVGPVAYFGTWGDFNWTSTAYAYMFVKKVTGTQSADYISQ